MPIEIRELVIKVTVAGEPVGSPATVPGLPGVTELRQWQQELTQACVRQVLAELQRRQER